MRSATSMIRASLLASIAFSSVVISGAAFAQQAAAADEAGEEMIIVTASKRSATLQDTPISVSVTGKEAIQRSQIRDLKDLSTLVPSLRVSQLQSSANTNFIIRGFGNGANNAGIEPSVGVFIDGVYRSRSAAQIGDLPDLERIEVLRGPQSTLFGKNASAGIISIITREPQFELGGNAEASYGNYNAIIAKASVTGPITDKIAVSLAGNFNKRDGYAQDLNLNTDVNDRNRWGVRGSLLFKPSDDFKLRLIADYDKLDENCCIAANVVDGPTGGAVRALGGKIDSRNPFSYNIYNNFLSSNKIENYGFSAQSDWNLNDSLAVTAIGAYRAVRAKTNQDSDFTSADLIGENSNDTRINTYTAELRLASSFDGPLNFLVGGFFFHEKIDIDAALTLGKDFRNYANILSDASGRFLPGGNYVGLESILAPFGVAAGSFGGRGQGRFEHYNYKDQAVSIFGQVDYEITDGLTLTVGANYTNDRKDVSSNSRSTDVFSSLDLTAIGTQLPAALRPLLTGLKDLQFLPQFLNFPNAVEDGKTRDSDLSYTLRLAYKIDTRFSTYATYATGFKASSFNLGPDSRPFARDFIPGSPVTNPAPSAIRTAGLALPNLTTGTRFADPENAEVFEVGLKGQVEGFAFNVAVFKQSLKGFQGNVFVGTGFVLSNAEKQSTFGVELDTSFTPVRNFNVTFNLTYLNPKFDSYTGGSTLIASGICPATGKAVSYGTCPTDLSGRRPAGIPEFSLSVGSTYTHEFNDDLKAIFHVDYNYESPVAIVDGLPQIKREVQGLNAAVSLDIGKGLELTAWGRNLANTQYLTVIFPSVAQSGSMSGYPSQPRTYGGAIRYRF